MITVPRGAGWRFWCVASRLRALTRTFSLGTRSVTLHDESSSDDRAGGMSLGPGDSALGPLALSLGRLHDPATQQGLFKAPGCQRGGGRNLGVLSAAPTPCSRQRGAGRGTVVPRGSWCLESGGMSVTS